MKILLTNDDGLMAPGLQALRHALREIGDVTAVAPDSGRSAMAHAITFNEPIYVETVTFEDGTAGYALSANPADCVKFAYMEVFHEKRADLLVSGINAGANVGINVFYSGTVSAAMEGAFLGMPSVAVSLSCDSMDKDVDFDAAARLAVKLIRRCVDSGLPGGMVMNINLPPLSEGGPKGVRIARHCTKGYVDRFERRANPRGRPYYWMTGQISVEDAAPDTDVAALSAGYVTVTPLVRDLTRHDFLEEAERWQWEGCT